MAPCSDAAAPDERALAIDEASFGEDRRDHPTVASDGNNLGSVLHDLGDLTSRPSLVPRTDGVAAEGGPGMDSHGRMDHHPKGSGS